MLKFSLIGVKTEKTSFHLFNRVVLTLLFAKHCSMCQAEFTKLKRTQYDRNTHDYFGRQAEHWPRKQKKFSIALKLRFRKFK